MAESIAQQIQNELKYDWYQTAEAIVITVLIKNVKPDDLKLQMNEKQIYLEIERENTKLSKNFELSYKIQAEQSNYKITPSKIEIKLKKCEDIRWEKLIGPIDQNISQINTQPENINNGPPTYPTSRKGKDWSAIEKCIKEEESKEKVEGEDGLNKLFQDLYSKGSDEVKKAMNKSFMESGGTVLSTNWNEISQKKVDVKPPDGVEFRRWD